MAHIKNREKYLKENPIDKGCWMFIICVILCFALSLYAFKDHYIDLKTGKTFIKK